MSTVRRAASGPPLSRISSTRAHLVRLGFQHGDEAAADLDRLRDRVGDSADDLLKRLAGSADPDLALRSLADLLPAADRRGGGGDPLAAALCDDERLADRLVAVLGASAALGEWLVRHPDGWRELRGTDPVWSGPHRLRASVLTAVHADAGSDAPVAALPDAEAVDALRVWYRRLLLRLAADDLAGGWRLDEAAQALADLAGATLEGATAIGRARIGADLAVSCRLAVIAMGKTGGRELNYVSDVDVVFAYAPADAADEQDALRVATRLATHVVQVCSAHTAEGTIWPVDVALRPEGKTGPLVRTVASHLAYYQRWAKTWEFQALLKARPVAGDTALGRDYLAAICPLVWAAARREHFVPDVRAMRRRVVDHIPAEVVDRQLKLGPGGLRDVEFAVQLLQLVHGRDDPSVRQHSTLAALEALTARGYVGRTDGAALAESYRFLRTLEHRIQLYALHRTHLVPTDESDLRRLGRALGFFTDPGASVLEHWRQHNHEVRRLHEKLFYRPLLDTVAALPGSELRMSADAARERLAALGYADPRAALAHLETLTAGVSRTAAIQRQLLPALLAWFADGPDPDAGLLAFRTVSESLGRSHWFLRHLRDGGEGAHQLATLLASSRYVTQLVTGAPDSIAMLGDPTELVPRSRGALTAEVAAAQRRQGDPRAAVGAVRAMRRRELFRTAAADVLGLLDVDDVAQRLSDICLVTLGGALRAACRAVEAERRSPLPTRVAIVAMGRLGGHELSYASDADVMFVHVPVAGAGEQDAARAASAVAQEVGRSLAVPGADPPLSVDAGLRPEGKDGPLVRTLASYAAYYARWSSVWEAQALLRADPVIGDPEVCARFAALIEPIRWPTGGLDEDDVLEVRRIKARVDAERMPRGVDPSLHLKLGRGGLSDVEWTVQLLQLRHAHEVPGLRTPAMMEALRAATEAGLLDPGDGATLTSAWHSASRVRNAVLLARGRPGDAIPNDPRERARVAHLLGYPAEAAGRAVDDYLRTARRARAVVERVFWT